MKRSRRLRAIRLSTFALLSVFSFLWLINCLEAAIKFQVHYMGIITEYEYYDYDLDDWVTEVDTSTITFIPDDPLVIFNSQLGYATENEQSIELDDDGLPFAVDTSEMSHWIAGEDGGNLIDTMSEYYDRYPDDVGDGDKRGESDDEDVEPGGYLCFVHRVLSDLENGWGGDVDGCCVNDRKDTEGDTNYHADARAAVAVVHIVEAYGESNAEEEILVTVAHEAGHMFNFWHCPIGAGACLMLEDPHGLAGPYKTFSNSCFAPDSSHFELLKYYLP